MGTERGGEVGAATRDSAGKLASRGCAGKVAAVAVIVVRCYTYTVLAAAAAASDHESVCHAALCGGWLLADSFGPTTAREREPHKDREAGSRRLLGCKHPDGPEWLLASNVLPSLPTRCVPTIIQQVARQTQPQCPVWAGGPSL